MIYCVELSLGKKFDIITLWHVLEHLKDPEKYIETIYGLLNRKGILYVEVPNFSSWTAKMTKQHWMGMDYQHHLTFFTPISLANLLKKYNFRIEKIRTFSLEYSTFISVQSIVNSLTDSDSYFFEALYLGDFNLKIIFHAFLFIILIIPCFLINLCLYFYQGGEVITVVAIKEG